MSGTKYDSRYLFPRLSGSRLIHRQFPHATSGFVSISVASNLMNVLTGYRGPFVFSTSLLHLP